ncbi:MAG: hypothetical protein H8E66_17065 [Planctomycetes bacterium]|nr:hypothetical protein [Planctomycetota bacterium]
MFRVRIVALFVAACVTVSVIHAAPILQETESGDPQIKSINVISFAPQGVLLIGDGTGSQIVAIETGDDVTKPKIEHKVDGIAAKLAARLGTTSDGIEIIDMAVNPASGTPYFAIRKQDDKRNLILTVDRQGEIGEFELNDVSHARIQLKAGKDNISRVTDVAWADTQIVAAGRSNETFASKIFSIDVPLKHKSVGSVYSAETYHVSHGRWETKAPMSVLIPVRENDKTYVIGAFSCTPVVKYPLDSLQPGAQVKGASMIELGSGNRPIDMFVYEKDGKSFVLSNTFRFHHERKPFGPSPYWTVKFDQGLLSGDETVNEKATRRLKGYEPVTDKISMAEAFHGVMQMDKLDRSHALVLRQNDEGISLEVLALP